MRILVIDDSAYNRKMIRSMLMEMAEVELVDIASDGEEAIKAVMTEPPDVITLDLNMPRMDGFTFLRWLMRNRPLPVVVVSSEGGEKNVFKALDLGALDFVVKPLRYASERIVEIRSELQEKVRAVASKNMKQYLDHLKASRPPRRYPVHHPSAATDDDIKGVLVIGASTGGPSAVQRVLSEIHEDFSLPIIVVQHMPPVFTRQFSLRLGKNTPLEAKEAEEGDPLVPGRILVVPGGYHLKMDDRQGHRVVLVEKQEGDRFVPSVDVTMTSAAEIFGRRVVGVLLTGMGNDGADGMSRIREMGGRTIAESEESTVVFGMPRAALQKGAVEEVLDLEEIPDRIMEMVRDISGLKNG
ncbi:MAG: chemotaxis-specific protein-glutamate methyltransferase CheB [bacterium]|nr:MAG: chemotaxis-specific protein-glutamate methyltransferase CheB [bacterium]